MTRFALLWVLAGCGAADLAVAPDAGGTPSIDGTPVESFEATSCSTADVLALSIQVTEQVDCMLPGQLVPFDASPMIEFSGGAVLPYLGADARDDLYAAAAAGGGTVVRVNSAFRTVVQQFLLRRWFELGRCGITAAALPGESNHETGRALDVGNFDAWVSIFDAHGWAHDVPGDPVHFDHLASPDVRGADVLAFQQLWNRNAPDDPIAEDGAYGPETEARLRRAPAEGFGIGASCGRARLRVVRASVAADACAR